MDAFALSVSSLVHRAEEFRIPYVRSKSFAIAVAVGIPIAVFLHDTSDHWMPTLWEIPIVSWFRRKWCQSAEEKSMHLTAMRNAIIFIFIAMALNETDFHQTPMDYVADRVSSSSARRALNERIQKARRTSFAAANELVGEEELNEANARQQRDTALRRRFVQENRASN